MGPIYDDHHHGQISPRYPWPVLGAHPPRRLITLEGYGYHLSSTRERTGRFGSPMYFNGQPKNSTVWSLQGLLALAKNGSKSEKNNDPEIIFDQLPEVFGVGN